MRANLQHRKAANKTHSEAPDHRQTDKVALRSPAGVSKRLGLITAKWQTQLRAEPAERLIAFVGLRLLT